MSNPSQTEEWVVSTLRDVETTLPPADLTCRIVKARDRFRLMPWVAASAAASFGAILVAAEILHPTTSLAQVATAQARQTEYTLINTMINGDGTEYVFTECRDGSRWSIHSKTLVIKNGVAVEPKRFVAGAFGSTVMDGTRTVHLRKLPGLINFAEIDDPKPREDQYEFDVNRILSRNHGSVTSSSGIEWHGHTVDRFQVHSTYISEGKTRTVDRTVIADTVSHLPLRVEEYRDGKSSGSSWDYQYGRPSGDQFKADFDEETTVFDLRKQRADLNRRLTQGVVLVEYGRSAEVLFPATNGRVRLVFPVKIVGSTVKMQATLVVKPGLGKPQPQVYVINGKRWQVATLVWPPFNDFNSFSQFQKAEVSLNIGDAHLTHVPVAHVSTAAKLLSPFSTR